MRLPAGLLTASFAVFACGEGATPAGAGGSGSATTTSAGAGAQGGDPSTGPTGAGGAIAAGGAGGAPEAAEVHLIGRFDASGAAPRATWSGSTALARFTGSEIAARLDGASDLWFEIVIDGSSVGRFVTTGGEQLYPLASGLSAGEHVVEIVRRNEGFFGAFSFLGFEPTGGALVASPSPHEHRIEFIGDSLTCGYGIEGSSATCNFSGSTESAYATYAMIASRDLGAAAHLVCYSGKGVHQNYGGDLVEPMPALYPRTLTGDANLAWDPADFAAEAVVVNLGTNDFSAALDDAAFVADYVTLLETVRSRHPAAYLLAITWAHWGAGNEALVADALATFNDENAGTLRFSIDPADGLGCDYHTNLVTNAKLGTLLTSTLQERLGW